MSEQPKTLQQAIDNLKNWTKDDFVCDSEFQEYFYLADSTRVDDSVAEDAALAWRKMHPADWDNQDIEQGSPYYDFFDAIAMRAYYNALNAVAKALGVNAYCLLLAIGDYKDGTNETPVGFDGLKQEYDKYYNDAVLSGTLSKEENEAYWTSSLVRNRF